MNQHTFYVYIMFNHKNGTIYTGVTNDLVRRVYEHKQKINPDAFTSRYNCDKLGYYEDFQYINDAIAREKQIKAGTRKYKIALIESINPNWQDLAQENLFWMR